MKLSQTRAASVVKAQLHACSHAAFW